MSATTRSQTTNNRQKSDTPTSSKRNLSPESKPNNEKPKKKSKPSKMSSKDIEELKSLITTSSSASEKRISDLLEKNFTDLGKKFNQEVQQLKNSVDEFKTQVGDDLNNVQIQLKNHNQRIENTEDDIERLKFSQDLRVIGFAYKDNENLVEIYQKIALEIGFNMAQCPNTPILERIPIRNKTTGLMIPSNTILFHFASVRQKQLFYSCYLNKMPLKPEKFGLTEEQRIIIGEQLTLKNAKLFKSAQTLRKDQKIAQTFTENGLIKIKFKKGKDSETFTIRNSIALESLVAQHAQAARTTEKEEQKKTTTESIATTTTVDSTKNTDTVTPTNTQSNKDTPERMETNGSEDGEISVESEDETT